MGRVSKAWFRVIRSMVLSTIGEERDRFREFGRLKINEYRRLVAIPAQRGGTTYPFRNICLIPRRACRVRSLVLDQRKPNMPVTMFPKPNPGTHSNLSLSQQLL